MKADVKPDVREKAALEWATEFLRNCAPNLKRGSMFHLEGKLRLERVLELYNSKEAKDYCLGVAHRFIAYDIKFAREGHPEALRHICLLAAVLLERGDPLPEPLGKFIAEYLRNPIKPRPRER